MRVRSAFIALLICGCGEFTDPATRLGTQLEAGAARLGSEDGATLELRDLRPILGQQCSGPYKVQLDQVGALVVWCGDEHGNTVSSHSTSHHADRVDFAGTYVFERPAGAGFGVLMERRGGRAVVVEVDTEGHR